LSLLDADAKLENPLDCRRSASNHSLRNAEVESSEFRVTVVAHQARSKRMELAVLDV
jgi:hypothetical protein